MLGMDTVFHSYRYQGRADCHDALHVRRYVFPHPADRADFKEDGTHRPSEGEDDQRLRQPVPGWFTFHCGEQRIRLRAALRQERERHRPVAAVHRRGEQQAGG